MGNVPRERGEKDRGARGLGLKYLKITTQKENESQGSWLDSKQRTKCYSHPRKQNTPGHSLVFFEDCRVIGPG